MFVASEPFSEAAAAQAQLEPAAAEHVTHGGLFGKEYGVMKIAHSYAGSDA